MTAASTGDVSSFLVSLNSAQRTAVEHASGPLLVIAGAGTGKTKTLAARVANLIKKGAAPNQILLLTFTRRAANEMIRRAGQVVGETVAAGVWGGTFHAIANRLLRIHAQALGLAKGFVVIDQGDAEDLLDLIRTDLGLHRLATRFPKKGTLLAIYSRCVNTGDSLEHVLSQRFPWCQDHAIELKNVFRQYGEHKIRRSLLDYDDLLMYWDQALATPNVSEAIAGRFQHVLVDEYQDTNPLQAALLSKMWNLISDGSPNPASAATSIMVVGDDAQAIFSFRGSTVENILRFPEEFSGSTTVTLEQNYRSVTPILEASNGVMAAAKRRYTKNLWSGKTSEQKPTLVTCADELDQSQYVADRILEHREEGIALMRQAVLFRAGHNSDALEIELGRRNIPFVKWGGLRFLEAAHIKDLLAFLRIVENPRDDLSWMRILQMLEGVGPGRARQAIEHMHESPDSAKELLAWNAPASAKESIQRLVRLLQELAGTDPELPLTAQIERIRLFYGPIFESRYEQPEMRIRDLDQLELLARQATSRASFLSDLTLDPPVSTSDLAGPPLLDEEYMVLSTIHSAKGCEWDVVFVIHAADGVLPSDMSVDEADLEEERRLLYVAMTRAKSRLYVTFPLRYYHRKNPFGDAYSMAQLSRFLPPELFPLFDRSTTKPAEADLAPQGHNTVPVTEGVRSRLSRLWD